MSTHAIEQALFDIASGPARALAYRTDPEAFLAAYPLLPEEIAVIRAMDVGTMLDRDINPMLAMRAFTAVEGRDAIPEYMRRIRRR